MTEEHERALPHDPDLEADEDPAGRPLPVHLTPHLIGLVFVGGCAGVLLRDLISIRFPVVSGFPYPTFAINIAGAFTLAVLIEALALRGPDVGHRRRWRLLLGTGVLGGFTTYSALAVQTDGILRAGHPLVALAYGAGTVVVGFGASLLGISLTRRALDP